MWVLAWEVFGVSYLKATFALRCSFLAFQLFKGTR